MSFVEARAAAAHLGLSRRTLYAYVSRGAVRSLPGTRGRQRMYALAGLERLRVRRDARVSRWGTLAVPLRAA